MGVVRQCSLASALWMILAACGPSTDNRPAVSTAPEPLEASRESAGESATPGPPGYRARFLVSPPEDSESQGWTEVDIAGESPASRLVCEAVLQHWMQRLSASGLDVELARPCDPAELPRMDAPPGFELIVPHPLTDADVVLLLAEDPPELPPGQLGTITDHALFSTRSECEDQRVRLTELRRADRLEAAETVRGFLRTQLAQAERTAEQSCAPVAEVEQRCAALPDAAEVEARCADAPEGARCRRAREDALERSSCEVGLQSQRRACDDDRALVELLRGRIESDDAPAEGALPECKLLY